jgi:3-oxoacyl-[acyl-carrier-protein] synthase-1
MRAGISGFAEHPFMIDTAGEPMRVAPAPLIEAGTPGVERFSRLLLPALEEALNPLDSLSWQGQRIRISIELGLPSGRPGLPPDIIEKLVAAIADHFPGRFSGTETFPVGHAAGLLALESAVKKLTLGEEDACLVAGVDSYLFPETLEWLEECDQLHGAGSLNNAWGFVPGEAAGALLVIREERARHLGLTSFGQIIRVGIAHERNLINTDSICIGEGLTAAFRLALAAVPVGMKVNNIFCDMNGEPYRSDEYGFTALRTNEYFDAVGEFTAPADCWGDVGAATGSLCAALAVISHRKGYGKGPLSLVWGSSGGGERAAALIQALDKGNS